jgi:hypothetical protein
MFTFQDLEPLEVGARFYTADLHVHTSNGSSDVSDGDMTIEAVIDSAVAMGVNLLAITDHNNDVNVLPSLAYGAQHSGKLLVLPGVEITTANGHLLVYGDPSKPDLIGVLLAKIDIKGPKGGRDSRTARSMADVIDEAATLGLICIAAHIDRDKTGFDKLATGYPGWKKDILLSTGLYGLDFDDAAHLKWFSEDEVEISDAANERRSIAKQRRTALLNHGRPALAAIQTSDAHTIGDFLTNASGSSLTRFKMTSLSFEGFRTALMDPEARIRPRATIPSAIPRVCGISMVSGFLNGEAYRFSDNLNTFIGGRGTGKSTAVKSLAYGLGLSNDFGAADNCPDAVTVLCEDASGVRYRYERQKGARSAAKSKLGKTVQDVPLDSFRVEYYGQGHLSEVAKDPLRNPALLQAFLDRHITLTDLVSEEAMLIEQLQSNSGQLIPLEASNRQLIQAQKDLKEVEQKLEAAKEGKLQELAELQGKIAAEKSLLQGIGDFATSYEAGLVFDAAKKDFAALRTAVGELTGDEGTTAAFKVAQETVEAINGWVDLQQTEFNAALAAWATAVRESVGGVPASHSKWDDEIANKTAQLQKQGLSGGIAQLSKLIEDRAKHVRNIATLTSQLAALQPIRERRQELLAELAAIREEMSTRRKGQIETINQSFKETIDDYSIYLYYDSEGLCEQFIKVLLEAMQGTFFQEKAAQQFCEATTPGALSSYIVEGDIASIGAIAGIGGVWAQQIAQQLSVLQRLHKLQVTPKPPCPRIKVLTKTQPQKQIPVNQLSDGQKHTILLAIAMLAESNDPLIIDQPEDDLDNAFIFKSVVRTLRFIKERRQVIVVTHNANIAVLGDSELLFPMRRVADKGQAFDRGSIDHPPTKQAVQDVLEGGTTAFLRRKAIYGV